MLYKTYLAFTHVPETPQMDLNFWWGPNHTRDSHDDSIRPYRILFSEAMQMDISRRFEYYRLRTIPKSMADVAFTYGFNSEALDRVYNYWSFKYNMDERERYFRKYKHYKTNIQGLDIHYVHVVHLLMLHGWPSSFVEFYELVPLLNRARSDYGFTFELIIPSLPGFGYSQGAVRPGLGPAQIAVIMRNLMHRIGIKKFYVHGGDLGHIVGSHMITLFPKEVAGFHTIFPVNFSKMSLITWLVGALYPKLFLDQSVIQKMYPIEEKTNFFLEESGYLHIQMTKPDSIGTALTESPMGLASYILEKFSTFSDPSNKFKTDGGLPDNGTLTRLLDNVMVYWITESITTSMRVYKEIVNNNELEKTLNNIPTPVPTWALRPYQEVIYQPDFMLKWKYSSLLGTTDPKGGGRFIAYEDPKLLADDLFKAVNIFERFHLDNEKK
ncbi:Juvenile hormone epoxide hydrolase [Eumeta japonica]|uniref:Epoxide hydrolase n=1 Tax=Eumeta variegata TaxID=151549 RepID=A0A4C1Y9P3_EUMVA|nr:Juvenile hormone epoxide hydrolase [Eumeta japonica]